MSPQLFAENGTRSECVDLPGANCFVYDVEWPCVLRAAQSCDALKNLHQFDFQNLDLNSETGLQRVNVLRVNVTSFQLEQVIPQRSEFQNSR